MNEEMKDLLSRGHPGGWLSVAQATNVEIASVSANESDRPSDDEMKGCVERLLANGPAGVLSILSNADPEYSYKVQCYAEHFKAEIFQALRSLKRTDSAAGREAQKLTALLPFAVTQNAAGARAVFPPDAPEQALSSSQLAYRFIEISTRVGIFD